MGQESDITSLLVKYSIETCDSTTLLPIACLTQK